MIRILLILAILLLSGCDLRDPVPMVTFQRDVPPVRLYVIIEFAPGVGGYLLGDRGDELLTLEIIERRFHDGIMDVAAREVPVQHGDNTILVAAAPDAELGLYLHGDKGLKRQLTDRAISVGPVLSSGATQNFLVRLP